VIVTTINAVLQRVPPKDFIIGAEDQVNLLETAPLGAKQKAFPAVLRRATLVEVFHARDICCHSQNNNMEVV
jgi:hypothetical protein